LWKTFAPSSPKRAHIKADEIAARQACLLNQHRGPRDKKLRLIDIKEMYLQMRDHA
jgi:hypothetical protein